MDQTGSNLGLGNGQRVVRVLFADDFAPFRQNLIAAFVATGKLELAGEASNGQEAIEMARTLHPDVIVMDYRMPGYDGVAASTRIQEDNPNVAIILTSLSFERPYILRALAAGVRGYLAKDDALDALLTAVERVLAGERYLSPSVSALIERTAPASPLSVTQKALWIFDQEAPALLHCARSVADQQNADAAVSAAFRSYWMALRESQVIADPQTWLLLSVAAQLFLARGPVTAWSMFRAHPQDRELKNRTPRLLTHVAGCRSCHLAWTLAAHDTKAIADPEPLREALIRQMETPDEAALFLNYTERQAGVMRLAVSEIELLLGSSAGKGWVRREASAGSWLSALLGNSPRKEAVNP